MTGSPDYHYIMMNLRQPSHQQEAEAQDLREPIEWKRTLRQQFLSLVPQEHKTKLLERRLRHITAPFFDLVSFRMHPSEMKPLSFQYLILRAKHEKDRTQEEEIQ